MKGLKKALKSFAFVFLLFGISSVIAMLHYVAYAQNTSSTVSNSSMFMQSDSSEESTSNTSSTVISSDITNFESSDQSDYVSSENESENESSLSNEGNYIISSDSASSKVNSENKTSSQIVIQFSSQVSSTTASKVGGRIDDGIDTSGWGTGDDDLTTTSAVQSAGVESNKSGDKKIMDLAKIFWMLIWIPVLFIVASIAALIYVNKKSFIEGSGKGENEDLPKKDDADEKKEPSKAKKSGKHDTIYRPRD